MNCVICTRPIPIERGDVLACGPCETKMHDRLADIVNYYALTEGELVPGSGTGTRGSERSLGVRLAALDFLAGNDVVAVLASWESEWREHYGLTIQPMLTRPTPLLARSVAFLRAWLPRACTDHPAVDEFARELHDCWQTARNAARMSPARTMTITCVADIERAGTTRTCSSRIPVSPDNITSQVTCNRCRTTWDVPHLIHVAISTPGAELWADPEAAAGYFHVDPSTLRKWARAGRIRRDHGRYELHSVHAAIAGVSQAGVQA